MCKINVKKSILEIVEKNNLEILKIDLCNDEESAARFYGGGRDVFSCKAYTTLEDLDFEVDSPFMQEEVQGTVYCRDKDTKEPVWIVSYGDEGGSWWEVNRVPEFYKNRLKKLEIKEGKIKFLINQAISWLEEYNQDSLYIDAAMDELRNALKELEG